MVLELPRAFFGTDRFKHTYSKPRRRLRSNTMKKTLSFYLSSFSYPPNLRESLLAKNTETISEKVTTLQSKCQEKLLIKGNKSIEELKQIILDFYHNKYVILYVNYDDFMFKDDTNEILLKNQDNKIIFRIFSTTNLKIYEVLFYLIYKELDVNTITPHWYKPIRPS